MNPSVISLKKTVTTNRVYAKAKKNSSAVAKDFGGNANNIAAVLRKLGAKVTASCNPKTYDGLVLPGGTDIAPSRYSEKKEAEAFLHFAASQKYAIVFIIANINTNHETPR